MTGSTQIASPQEVLRLDITPDKLMGLTDALDDGGIGNFVVRNVLNEEQLDYVMQEVNNPDNVAWRDNHNVSTHKRHGVLIENHDEFALRIGTGNQKFVDRIPRLMQAGLRIQGLIRGLGYQFPTLRNWSFNELSLHRYDDKETGLSYHKDNARYRGLVGVLTLQGTSELSLASDSGVENIVCLSSGDLSLTRVNGLLSVVDETSSPANDCPDHKVVNLQTPTRTALIVRSNSRPHEEVPGFTFDNWP